MKLTVDIIALTGNNEIVMIKRRKKPYMDKFVLPGGHVEEKDLDLAHAATRELVEETGILIDPGQLSVLTVLDAPDRDPRPERRISVVFIVKLRNSQLQGLKAGSDARCVCVKNLDALLPKQIGFDHFKAIKHIKNLLNMHKSA